MRRKPWRPAITVPHLVVALIGLVVVLLLLTAWVVTRSSLGSGWGDKAGSLTALYTAGLVLVTVLLFGATAIAALDAREELSHSRAIAQMDFLFRLDARFRSPEHYRVHQKLRDDGAWAPATNKGPDTSADWRATTSHLRLFERIYLLVRDGSIEEDVVKRAYGYRIEEVARNEIIVARAWACREEPPWDSFRALWQLVDPEDFEERGRTRPDVSAEDAAGNGRR